MSPTFEPKHPKAPTTGGGAKQTTPLRPVTSVWLITLAGGTFAQALAQPAAAPYVDSQLTKAGTLLNGWSALAGSAFASEAGLLAGTPPQNLDAIVQPPCPEGAAGVPCKPETAGALTAADEFLKATIPTIMSNPAYGAHGLIVITFATVGNATASSLPAGSSTATLGSEPPAGVLLISPFVAPARGRARRMTRLPPSRACPRFCTDHANNPQSNQPTKETHVVRTTHRRPQSHVVASRDRGSLAALSLAMPAIGSAEETNPNNYSCLGSLSAGKPEVGSEEQQVAYAFHCSGPITGYQLQSQIPVTGVQAAPLISNIPVGHARERHVLLLLGSSRLRRYCVGATVSQYAQYETIAGQFAIATKLCAEPRVDALLTVTYAYLEKGVVTQAISGPFDLGRPTSCPPDAQSGWTRLNPKPVVLAAVGKHKGKGKGHKGRGHGKGHRKKASKKRS